MKLTASSIARAIKIPMEKWRHNCHGVSIAIVKSGIFGPSRVARGWCNGVTSQHSWVVLGQSCYDEDAEIVDCTLWSYCAAPKVWRGKNLERHHPHGEGSIWDYGKPIPGNGEIITLTPSIPFSKAAIDFLKMMGPLDLTGWFVLAKAPVSGWPAGEIFAAMCDTKALKAVVPIDILGMTTDRNPGGLYLQ